MSTPDEAADRLKAALGPFEEPTTFTVWKPSQFLAYEEPVDQELLGGYLVRGEPTTLQGQGGLGKSRLMLWMSICQVLGMDFCGLPTAGGDVRWLHLGNENSVLRYKKDLERMTEPFSDGERERIESLLRLQAIRTPDDRYVCLDNPATQQRLYETIRSNEAQSVVLDPFASFAPGDIAKHVDCRAALVLTNQIVSQAAPDAAQIYVHHARTGRDNIAQAAGWDKANFGLGAKAIFSYSRAVINIAPASEDDHNKLVMVCAKSNNCEPFSPRGILFDPERYTYGLDPDFDLERWKDDVEGKRAHSSCTILDIIQAVQSGHRTSKEIITSVSEHVGCAKRTVQRRINEARAKGYLESAPQGEWMLGKNARQYTNGR